MKADALGDVAGGEAHDRRAREAADHVAADQVHAPVGDDPQLAVAAGADPPGHRDPGGELGRRAELLVDELGPAEEGDVVSGGSGAHGRIIPRGYCSCSVGRIRTSLIATCLGRVTT